MDAIGIERKKSNKLGKGNERRRKNGWKRKIRKGKRKEENVTKRTRKKEREKERQ